MLLRGNFSSFPQYFQYISNLGVKLHIHSVKGGCSINCFPQFHKSDMSKYGYLEVFRSPLEFEITRVDCILNGLSNIFKGLYYINYKQNCKILRDIMAPCPQCRGQITILGAAMVPWHPLDIVDLPLGCKWNGCGVSEKKTHILTH